MKPHILFPVTFFLIIIGLSCTDSTDHNPVIEQEESEENIFFDGEMHTPSGLLAFVSNYQGKFLSKQQRFYDSKNRNTFRVAINNEGDTSGIHKLSYDDRDRLIRGESHTFTAGAAISNKYEHIYENNGQLEKVIDRLPDGGSRFSRQLVYDEEGRLMEMQFSESGNGEKYIYEYEGDRIKAMRWTSGDDDPKMFVHGLLYRYDEEGLLVAKEYFTHYVTPEAGEGNMFEYDYDEQGRLVEEREYFPIWGFELNIRKTYEYYE